MRHCSLCLMRMTSGTKPVNYGENFEYSHQKKCELWFPMIQQGFVLNDIIIKHKLLSPFWGRFCDQKLKFGFGSNTPKTMILWSLGGTIRHKTVWGKVQSGTKQFGGRYNPAQNSLGEGTIRHKTVWGKVQSGTNSIVARCNPAQNHFERGDIRHKMGLDGVLPGTQNWL